MVRPHGASKNKAHHVDTFAMTAMWQKINQKWVCWNMTVLVMDMDMLVTTLSLKAEGLFVHSAASEMGPIERL